MIILDIIARGLLIVTLGVAIKSIVDDYKSGELKEFIEEIF